MKKTFFVKFYIPCCWIDGDTILFFRDPKVPDGLDEAGIELPASLLLGQGILRPEFGRNGDGSLKIKELKNILEICF